ncbi:exosome complex component RRP4 [Sarotherodon galilaeus]
MGRHILLKGLQMYLLQTLGFAWLIFGFSTDCVSAAGANAASRNDCGQDCTETQYDTQEAARCGNKFHPGASLSCCGKEPYNPEVATCCKVQDRNTLREAFDKDKQLCCGASDKKMILMRNSSFHQCCGHNQYDNRTQCCCENKEGVLEVQPKNSSCCDKNSTAGVHNMGKYLHCGPNDDKTSLVRNSSFHRCCGRNQYDNRTQCCCENKEGVLEVQAKNSSCCDKNSTTGVHHVGNLHCGPNDNKKSLVRNSSFHRCCGHNQYDNRTQCCCENKEGVLEVQLKNSSCCDKSSTAGVHNVGNLHCGPNDNKKSLERNSSFHRCCGHNQYDNRTQCCCENKEGVLEVQPKNSSCCDKNSTTGVHHVGNLHCGPNDNKKSLVRNSSFHQCCGHNQYDNRTQCCCENKEGVLEVQLKNSSCCDKSSTAGVHNVGKYLHCGPNDNKKSLERNSSFHRCCGHNQYDNRTQCCCENKEGVLEVQPKNSSCCDKSSTTGVHHVGNLLCGPNDNKKSLVRNSSFHRCCGHNQYDNRTQCCCENKEGVLEIQPKHSDCCAKESAKPEGFRQLTHRLQHCCTEPNTHLCGSTCYNPKTHRCCERHQKPFWFCASGKRKARVYDPRIEVCCDGSVSPWKPWIDQFYGSPGQHCCGTEIYRPRTEICCNGHRHPKSENIHCCGVKAYNIKDPQMKCCAGTLYNLTSLDKHGRDAQCCGSILQEPQDICCSSQKKEVLYSVKTGFGCCGHLYYNTTLWSCCAGRLRSIHEPGQDQRKMTHGSRLLSLNNLNTSDLCKEMYTGTVESVSVKSVVFRNVLKVHGNNVTALPLHYILDIDNHCQSPKLFLGKTYIFNKVNVFTDFNHDSVLQSLHFIFSKCSS